MAKKKINIKSVSTDVESGDVNISYKNVRIAGLSESTTAVLETEDTICEDDIEVEYNRPTNLYYVKEVMITSNITAAQGNAILGWAWTDSNGDMNVSGIGAGSTDAITFYYDRSGQTLSLLIMPLLTPGLTLTLTADGSPVTLTAIVPDKLYLARLPFNTSEVTISAS